MILFASGRSDIPAFYSKWFMNRINEGYVDVRNPYDQKHVTRYKLASSCVDAIVFCTKNPEPILPYISELKSKFGVYFFVTITPYEEDVEPNVPKKEDVLASFIKLSELIGKKSLCWRYDPIFIDGKYTVSYHIKKFREFAEKLKNYTDRCIISFVDLYAKTKKNFPELTEVNENDQKFLAQAFGRIGFETGIKIESCAEKIDFSPYGIEAGSCISKEIIELSTEKRILEKGKQNLRKHCNCLPTRDIGAYNSCPHLCKYCYANYDSRLVQKNFALHDENSSFLIGNSLSGDELKIAKQESWEDHQLLLF